MCSSKTTALIIAVSILTSTSARAIDIAVPSDMYPYVWDGNPNAVEPGYIITTIGTDDLNADLQRGYAVAFDEAGEIVFYRKQVRNKPFIHLSPQSYVNRHLFSTGHLADNDVIVLDSNLVSVDTIPSINPHHYGVIDFHEAVYDESGNLWTLWKRWETVDMSQYINGGNPDCLVTDNFIQKWDPDGNLLWEWFGLDHLDEFPFMATQDTTDLYGDRLDHFHTNSVSFSPEGDILLSIRNLSVIALIDYPTGGVIWKLGGGTVNEFTFTGDGNEYPLDFNRQHDAQYMENGNISVFDNGNYHPVPRSYAREYAVNPDSMTAELVYCYAYPELSYSVITGSYRPIPGGHRLIHWGESFDLVNTTELDENDEIVWSLSFEDDPVMDGWMHDYRAYKIPSIGPAAVPYVSEVIDYDNHQIELVCNWWGHHDEVAAYEVWWGADEADELMGTTDTGYYYIFDYIPTEIYMAKIRALDADGNVISDFSNEIEVNTNPLDVEEVTVAPEKPQTVTLAPVYPNPFNARANVNVILPQPSDVELQVFDMLGRRVAELYRGHLTAGKHPFSLDAGSLSSGMYFIQLYDPEGGRQVRRITLIK